MAVDPMKSEIVECQVCWTPHDAMESCRVCEEGKQADRDLEEDPTFQELTKVLAEVPPPEDPDDDEDEWPQPDEQDDVMDAIAVARHVGEFRYEWERVQ